MLCVLAQHENSLATVSGKVSLITHFAVLKLSLRVISIDQSLAHRALLPQFFDTYVLPCSTHVCLAQRMFVLLNVCLSCSKQSIAGISCLFFSFYRFIVVYTIIIKIFIIIISVAFVVILQCIDSLDTMYSVFASIICVLRLILTTLRAVVCF